MANTKGCVIKPCSCVSQFQDEEYGSNLRVMNASVKGFRCTVCAKEKVPVIATKTIVDKPKKKKGGKK